MRPAVLILGVGALLAASACNHKTEDRARQLTGGDPSRGRDAIRSYGCYTCHTIPGIQGADGNVGPILDKFARRNYIAGVLENSPENLAAWLRNPPAVDPKTAMPNLGISDEDIRDISSYLYTLE
jgi:cytochrome c